MTGVNPAFKSLLENAGLNFSVPTEQPSKMTKVVSLFKRSVVPAETPSPGLQDKKVGLQSQDLTHTKLESLVRGLSFGKDHIEAKHEQLKMAYNRNSSEARAATVKEMRAIVTVWQQEQKKINYLVAIAGKHEIRKDPNLKELQDLQKTITVKLGEIEKTIIEHDKKVVADLRANVLKPFKEELTTSTSLKTMLRALTELSRIERSLQEVPQTRESKALSREVKALQNDIQTELFNTINLDPHLSLMLTNALVGEQVILPDVMYHTLTNGEVLDQFNAFILKAAIVQAENRELVSQGEHPKQNMELRDMAQDINVTVMNREFTKYVELIQNKAMGTNPQVMLDNFPLGIGLTAGEALKTSDPTAARQADWDPQLLNDQIEGLDERFKDNARLQQEERYRPYPGVPGIWRKGGWITERTSSRQEGDREIFQSGTYGFSLTIPGHEPRKASISLDLSTSLLTPRQKEFLGTLNEDQRTFAKKVIEEFRNQYTGKENPDDLLNTIIEHTLWRNEDFAIEILGRDTVARGGLLVEEKPELSLFSDPDVRMNLKEMATERLTYDQTKFVMKVIETFQNKFTGSQNPEELLKEIIASTLDSADFTREMLGDKAGEGVMLRDNPLLTKFESPEIQKNVLEIASTFYDQTQKSMNRLFFEVGHDPEAKVGALRQEVRQSPQQVEAKEILQTIQELLGPSIEIPNSVRTYLMANEKYRNEMRAYLTESKDIRAGNLIQLMAGESILSNPSLNNHMFELRNILGTGKNTQEHTDFLLNVLIPKATIPIDLDSMGSLTLDQTNFAVKVAQEFKAQYTGEQNPKDLIKDIVGQTLQSHKDFEGQILEDGKTLADNPQFKLFEDPSVQDMLEKVAQAFHEQSQATIQTKLVDASAPDGLGPAGKVLKSLQEFVGPLFDIPPSTRNYLLANDKNCKAMESFLLRAKEVREENLKRLKTGEPLIEIDPELNLRQMQVMDNIGVGDAYGDRLVFLSVVLSPKATVGNTQLMTDAMLRGISDSAMTHRSFADKIRRANPAQIDSLIKMYPEHEKELRQCQLQGYWKYSEKPPIIKNLQWIGSETQFQENGAFASGVLEVNVRLVGKKTYTEQAFLSLAPLYELRPDLTKKQVEEITLLINLHADAGKFPEDALNLWKGSDDPVLRALVENEDFVNELKSISENFSSQTTSSAARIILNLGEGEPEQTN